ncbi:MAG: acyltransferase [Alphaproteobacteria bacterium]|nr:acyltransferase [Alphaproteobacteria bacterium]
MSKHSLPSSTNEIKPLTGIRGIAAFGVMLYHINYNAHFPNSIFSFTHKSYLFVDLFFILSGFVLALRYREWFVTRLTPSRALSFMAQRLGRIYPAYFVATSLYYVRWLVNLSGHRLTEFNAHDILANLLLIQGWGINTEAICGPGWSVSTEMFAYLLFPILIFFFTAKGLGRCALLVVAAVAGICCVAASPYGVNGALDVVNTSFMPLLRCVSEFCLGLVAFEVAHHEACERILSRVWVVPLLLIVMAGLLGLDISDVLFVLTIPILVISLSYNGRMSSLLFGNRFIHRLGVISYSLYLLHPLMIDIAGRLMQISANRYGITAQVPFIAFAIVCAVAAASFMQRSVEIQGRSFVKKLTLRLLPAAPSTGNLL